MLLNHVNIREVNKIIKLIVINTLLTYLDGYGCHPWIL